MMLRIALVAVMVASITGVVALTGILPTSAQSAPTPSATRSFDSTSVAPEGQVVVTIAAADYGSAGGVTETLPAGFAYVSSSLAASQVTELSGNRVRFTLQGDASFTYTVRASSTPGPYDFSGTLRDFERDDYPVGGATSLPVDAPSTPTPSATRSFDSTSVAPEGQVVVTIAAADYGSAGGVTETLPAGFAYVSSSLAASQVTELSGNRVRFTLQGDASFTYTVTASSTPGPYDFSGTLRDFDKTDHTVGGATSLPVDAPSTPTPSATRSFDSTSVAPEGQVVVTIAAADYGSAGGVTETLPAGFAYVSSSLAASQVTELSGNRVRFTLQGDASFTYTVTASSTPGPYDFSGTLRDFDKTDHTVGGATSLPVEAPSTPTPSAARSFDSTSVAPEGQVVVTIAAADYGSAGGVTETLPAGFAYVSSSLAASQVTELSGNRVRFTLQGDASFTYTVTASSTPGPYDFSGTLRDFDKTDHTVGGATSLPVRGPSATRSFSSTSVAPEGQVVVTIAVADYGSAGGVTETLPAGFAYVSSSLAASQVTELSGNRVRFTLQGDASFTYTVRASSTPGPYDFSGTLRDFDKTDHTVGGATGATSATMVTVEGPSATRSFSSTSVARGGRVVVSIRATNYGEAGGVTETLPSGFSYVSSSLRASQVTELSGNRVRFTLQGDASFTYTVTASSTPGPYDFSGTLRDFERDDYPVGGATSLPVRVADPEPEPDPQRNRAPTFPGSLTTRSIDENLAFGANVGDAVRATDADLDRLTYALGGTDASSFTINSSGQIMVGTGTMLDFEDKPSYTVTVSATDPDNASDTITVTVTVVNVDEDGMVTITPDTTPQVGTELTASLEDPDGSVANLTWQWQKDDGQGSYTDIPGATMMSYTPVMADDGRRLQATAMYDDGEGSGKEAMGMTANAVGATGDIVSRYDTDGTPGISEIEASIAVLDYLIRSEITRDEAIQVVTAYREDPLIVGHLNTVTGSLSYFGPEQNNGVELAALHVNQAGGVLGAQMIIVTGDTATNPVQGVAAARALVDVEGAVAIVGALASGVTLAVAQSVTVPKQRLLISPASTSPAITVLEDDDFLFRTTVSDAAQGVVLARLAWEIGYETAGIMLINNAYGEGLADQFEETFASLGGRVTGKVPHEDSQPTYTSELEKATEGDPDVLLAISYPGQAEVYLRESLDGGYSDTFLFVDGTKSPEMMEVVGWDALEGMLGTAQGSPESPSLLEFQGSYAAVHGAPPEHPFIAENYDAAVLIALAAAKAGTTTDSVAIRDALRSIANPPGEAVGPGVEGIKKALMLIAEGKDINYEGAAGTVDFDENGDVTGYIEIWKVEGGEIKSTGRFELP